MAPMKRSRREVDEEVIEVESASSSLRQDDQRKRARLSTNHNAPSKSRAAPVSGAELSSEDEDDAMSAEDEGGPALPPATQYEMLRDGNFEHLANPELDDRRATQKFLKRRKQIGENHAADNAIIESITCVNFMCHNKLHVELGPLINFVVGLNGSGKSAVLTAITLCLGGKAASTNRGTSLKSLIKHGEEQAVLIVRLKNQGHDAYQPETYGKTIIVERHFTRSNTSGYKLKNAMGRLVSNKKGDVDDLIEYYQLQVDNPMNVLNQDAAKTFIQTSTPKEKYKFFKEGVQLEALDNDYKLVSDICDQIEEKLEDSKDDLQSLKNRANETAEKAKAIQAQEGLKQRYKNIRRQSAWAQVAEVENKLAQRETAVSAAQEQIEQQEKVAEQRSQAFQKTDDLLEKAREAEGRLQEDLIPLKEEEEEARSAHDAAAKEVLNSRTERDTIKTNLREGQGNVDRVQKALAAESKRIEDSNGGAQARKQAEIKDAEQAVLSVKDAVTQCEQEGSRIEEHVRSADGDCKRIGAALGSKRREVDAARHQLAELNQDRGDVMAGYDPRMAQLIKAVRDEQRFREKPVGPVGLHLKLTKPIWSHTVEAILGTTLNSFIVTNNSDRVLMQNILKRITIKGVNVVTCQRREPLDTTDLEPDNQYDTILRVLNIDNDLVRNQLIINNAIEQTILIKDRQTGYNVMFDGPKPKNVRACLTLHDSKLTSGHRMTWMGRNNLEEITSVKFQIGRKPRMKSDIEGTLNNQKNIVEQLEKEKSRLETEQLQASAKVQRCKQMKLTNKRDQGQLKIDHQRAEQQVENLQVELDKVSVEGNSIDALNEEMAEAKRQLGIEQEAYGNIGLEIQRLNVISLEKKRTLDSIKERILDHEAKIKKAQLKINNTTQARKLTLEEKNAALTLVADFQEEKNLAERKRDKTAEEVGEMTHNATEVSLRVPIDEGETVASLNQKLKSMAKQIEDYRKRQGASDEEINDAAIEAQSIFTRAITTRKELEELLKMLKRSFMTRIEMYRRFQRHISCRSRINFNYLLSERAFRGKLTIDHKRQLLDVHVEPDETAKPGSKGRQTKTLSGGEKSFSSISLLLALWEAMGAPLRCLDEFDVFMDDVNRDVSTNMIISAARRSVGRQFILISPKALGAGANAVAEDVKIIKLYDPREKQRRVDEMLQDE